MNFVVYERENGQNTNKLHNKGGMIKEDRMREGGKEGEKTRREGWRWKEGVRARRTGENLKLE